MKSIAWIGSSQLAKVSVAFASLAILSRLIGPSDFGAFAIVLSILGLADLFRDLGLSVAAIQAESLDEVEQSNLFWANLFIGSALTVACCILAYPIAVAFSQDQLVSLLVIASFAFIINGASTQYKVKLVRSARFKAVAVTEIAAAGASLAAATAVALAGLGAVALALQGVVLAAITLLGVVLATRWIPKRPTFARSIRSFLQFGSTLLAVQLISYGSTNVDKLGIGKLYGTQALGYYSKAYTLYLQPLSQILAPFTNFVVARLSAIRGDRSAFVEELVRLQRVAGVIGFSVFAFAFGGASAVIAVLLGPSWGPSVPIFQILAVGGAFQMLGFVYYWMFLSLGATRIYLVCALVSQPVAIVLVLLALPLGVHAVAWATTVGNIVEWGVPATWGAHRALQSAGLLLRNAAGPSLIAVIIGAISFASTKVLAELPAVVQLTAALGAVAFIGVCVGGLVPSVRAYIYKSLIWVRTEYRS